MIDIDAPTDGSLQESDITLPWESIDPDEPMAKAASSEATVAISAEQSEDVWAERAFFDEDQPMPALPIVFTEAVRAKPVAVNHPAPEEKTPWSDMEPVMAEITAPPVDPPSVAATFARTDSILAAASELATLAESMNASAAADVDLEEPATTPAESDHVGHSVTSATVDLSASGGSENDPPMELEVEPPAIPGNGGWTIPLVCLGIGLIACCIIIPQGDFNRRLRYEQTSLQTNLQSIQKQTAVNDEFLRKVTDDPELAERLSSRQLKTIRKGQKVIPLDGQNAGDNSDISPFGLVAIAPPPEQPPYQPARGTLADLCNNARSRLYVLGAAAMMVAVGLVMGFGEEIGRRRS